MSAHNQIPDTGKPYQVISANRLDDGIVVYLAADGGWTERIANAHVIDDQDQSEAALSQAGDAVKACLIVDPYAIDIDVSNGEITPTLNRELIRAMGPTVRLDIGKQAAL